MTFKNKGLGSTKFLYSGLPVFAALVISLGLTACKKTTDTPAEAVAAPTPTPTPVAAKYLYVSSGTCYAGAGNTVFTNTTASNLVYRINVATGARDGTLADYNSSPATAGDSPVAIASVDSNSLYVLVENTTTVGARRIEKVAKNPSGTISSFSNNTTALSGVLRSLALTSGGDLLVSKSTAIEKISTANVRITKGANPYVNAPAAPCNTSTTLVTQVFSLNNQFVGFLHAAASQNRFGFVKAAGYATAGDCTVAQSAPTANAYPTAYAYDSANSKLIVAYAGNATSTDLNSIYSYDLTETSSSVTIGTANKLYDSADYPATYPYLLYGISAMAYDSANKTLYVSTAVSTTTTVANFAIEKFTYDPTKIGTANASVLTRVGTVPFYQYGYDTKCISEMIIAD
jgi:hypothetical protein